MIKPRIMKGPFPERSPYGEIGRTGSPLAYLIDPGAGSASDRVSRFWPGRVELEDITRRGGDITPLYPAVDDYSPMFGEAITGRTPSDQPNIPRTRAAITHYKRRVPFTAGGSVWSSSERAGIPVYEDTHPYTKLPRELLEKPFADVTQAETLLFARAADRPDHDLDRMIWYKFFYEPAITAGGWEKLVGTKHGWYSHSIDAACTLFLMKPSSVSTDPLDVVVAALEQRLDPDMVQFMKVTQ